MVCIPDGRESAPTCPEGWMQEIDECYASILVECLNYVELYSLQSFSKLLPKSFFKVFKKIIRHRNL